MRYFFRFLLLFLIVTLNACNSGSSSSSLPNPNSISSWTWMGGSNQSGAYGTYGTLGTPSMANIPGGRYIAISWVDPSGNFWLFGGTGNAMNGENGNLNDLWRYNPNTLQWTWMSGSNTANAFGIYGTQGVAADGNTPGARLGAVSWVDASGNLWLFGGFGNAASGIPGALNDLWTYNTTSNQWTWVNGANTTNESGAYGFKDVTDSNNMPGARLGSISWVDTNGNFWLFGGAEDILTARVYNDLWQYNPSRNQWTWVSGEQIINQPGIYGIQGTESITNEPGARLDSISWIDPNGNLWLFGGSGVDGVGTRGNLNDLWRYNPTHDQWTWMSGSNQKNSYGVYGTLGVASTNSIPGAREHRVPISWADNYGNLWMFGGDGNGATTSGILNDLWQYNPNNNQWAWMGGSKESNAFGMYSKIGFGSLINFPGARMDAVGFVDHNSNLWLFGGNGNGMSTNGYLNDLWKYNGLGSITPVSAIQYQQFTNYPGSTSGSRTIVTGIRGVNNSSNVYISGIYNDGSVNHGMIYQGPLSSVGGTWHALDYPSSTGVTVTGTSFYGPNNGNSSGSIQVVGNYTTSQSGTNALGLFYQGPTDGSGSWTTLLPPFAESGDPIVNTIAHSTMGGLVVGNYDTAAIVGNAFIYDINNNTYYNIVKPDAISITAYGIWYNGGTSYTIAGGFSNIQGISNGYIVDYDSSTHTFSNWTTYNYKNQPINSIASHFEGITTDGQGGYNLAAGVGSLSEDLSNDGGGGAAFVHVTRTGGNSGAFNSYATWTDIVYPSSVFITANTVFEGTLFGIYTVTKSSTAQVNSYIATVPASQQ